MLRSFAMQFLLLDVFPEWNEDTFLRLLMLVAVLNVACFALYGWDKFAAKRGSRRTPELVLLGASLPLTAIGAWGAVFLLRHKSSKSSYKWKLVGVTILQGAAVLAPFYGG